MKGGSVKDRSRRQQAGGTHPTGMHSRFFFFASHQKNFSGVIDLDFQPSFKLPEKDCIIYYP